MIGWGGDASLQLSNGSIGAELDANNQYAAGSDLFRLIVSSMVLVAHSMLVTGASSERFINAPYPQILSTVLIIFFGLSGFFVMASISRNRGVGAFLALRSLRLFPALGFEVVVTALVIGPIVTGLALGAYFTAPELRAYLLNIIGDIHYILPGVFEDNPVRAVNVSLWTIPLELMCLLALASLSLWRLDKSTLFLSVCVVGLLLLCLVVDHVDILRAHFAAGPHSQIIVATAFFVGVLIYDRRHVIPASRVATVVCLCVGTVLSAMPAWRVFAIPLICYATACLTLIDMKPPRFLRSGEYSYGIYIYGFPVQQVVYHYLPLPGNWVVNAVLAWPITITIAMISFHCIEKQALKLRRVVLARKTSQIGTSASRQWTIVAATAAMLAYFAALMQWSGLFGDPGLPLLAIFAVAVMGSMMIALSAKRMAASR